MRGQRRNALIGNVGFGYLFIVWLPMAAPAAEQQHYNHVTAPTAEQLHYNQQQLQQRSNSGTSSAMEHTVEMSSTTPGQLPSNWLADLEERKRRQDLLRLPQISTSQLPRQQFGWPSGWLEAADLQHLADDSSPSQSRPAPQHWSFLPSRHPSSSSSSAPVDLGEGMEVEGRGAVGAWSFPVPIVLETGINSTAYLKVSRISLSEHDSSGLCIAIVEAAEDCQAAALPPCASRALWRLSDSGSFLGFQVPRPSFTLGAQAAALGQNHSVCLWLNDSLVNLHLLKQNPILLGHLHYYPLPMVKFNGKIDRVGVRTFLNPGWHDEIHLECQNCSAASQLSVVPLKGEVNCKLLTGPVAAAIVAVENERSGISAADAIVRNIKLGIRDGSVPWPKDLICAPPEHGPCHGYIDGAFSIGRWHSSTPFHGGKDTDGSSELNGKGEIAKFVTESHSRLAAKQRRNLFHHRSAVCFYPDDGAPQGWLVGYIEFHMDGPDVQAFVSFVCFFGIALPLICMVTVLLHVNKQQRCKQHVRELRLELQRTQLERELNYRHEPVPRSQPVSSRSPTAREGRANSAASSSPSSSLLLLSGGDSRSAGARLPVPRVHVGQRLLSAHGQAIF